MTTSSNEHGTSDEISLIDLWLVLMRRKQVIAVVMITCVLIGIAFWNTRERQERYVTTIEIARYINDNGNLETIEPRISVKNRLLNAILPSLRNEIANRFEITLNSVPRVSITVPEFTVPEEGEPGNFVFLETTASPERKEIVEAMHRGIAERLASVHDRIFTTYQTRFSIRIARREIDLQEIKDDDRFRLRELAAETALTEARESLEEKKEAFSIAQKNRNHQLAQEKENQKAAIENFALREQNLEHRIRREEDRVEALAEEKKRLQARMDRLQVEETMIAEQMDDIREWMNIARESQQNLYEGVRKDTGVSLAALMIGNQAENARKELSRMQHRLSIELPENRLGLEAGIEENGRKTLEARETVAELQMGLEKLKQDHGRDVSERERDIALLEGNIAKAASDHRRDVETGKRRAERLEIQLNQIPADHQRSIERKQRDIELFASSGELMEATRAHAVVEPAATIGRNGLTILSLSIVMGLMLGMLAAFCSEFVAVAQKKA